MRLLYVEDERLIRESVAKQIQKMFPLEVFTACHGEEGVELFKKYKPERHFPRIYKCEGSSFPVLLYLTIGYLHCR